MPDAHFPGTMNTTLRSLRPLAFTLALATGVALVGGETSAQPDPLASWKDGAAKKAIVDFVRSTTNRSSPKFVPVDDRVATFDQDGTLWVSHPMYTQIIYCLEHLPEAVKAKPELAIVEPFKTALKVVESGNHEEIAKLPKEELEKILAATLTGMSVDTFTADVKKWLSTAKDRRWKRPYTELVYVPMIELMKYLRANGYKTYIATGGGQDFVRVYAQDVYGVPPEQVIGTAGGVKYGYDKSGRPFLTKEPKMLLNDNNAGKPEGIHLMIGRRPRAAFGNSTGDRRCSSTRRPATARACRCWSCTTTRSASTPTVRRRACPTPRSAPSRRRSTTRPRSRAGSSSA